MQILITFMRAIAFSLFLFLIFFLGFLTGVKQGEYMTRVEAMKEGHGVFLDTNQQLFVWRDIK